MADFQQQEAETQVDPAVVAKAEQPIEQAERVEQQAPEPTAADIETEARARAMGWVGKDEFRGPADKWRPAAEFVARGENELPILRDNLRRATDRIQSMERDYKTNLSNLERMTAVALQNQRQQLFQQFENEKRQAVAYGDVDRYNELHNQQWQAVNQFDEQSQRAMQQAHEQQQPNQQRQQVYSDEQQHQIGVWQQRNPWFNKDPELTSVAVAFSQRNGAANPQLSLAANLIETEKYIRSRYPEYFPSSRQAPAVEANGTRTGASMQRGKGVSDLPPDALAQGKKFVADGLFKSIEAYAKAYHEG